LQTGTLKCDKITSIVIDEADLMLDMGFLEDIKEILSYIENEKNIMLFSATMGPELIELSEEFMNSPAQIYEESDTQTVDTIIQTGYMVDDDNKYESFIKILQKENPENGIIFCGTRDMADILFHKLKKEKIWCGLLHGLVDQKERIKTIDEFKARGFRYLIATDVASRGVDFEKISHVINYDFPTSKETYVHRIGRTGRKGNSGKAISLIKDGEIKFLKTVEEYTNVSIDIKEIPTKEELLENNYKEKFFSSQKVKQVRIPKKGDVFHKQITKITIGGGKKSKLRTGDIVATISAIEGIDGKEDIGVIDIRDSISYVEILNGKGNLVLTELPKRTLKGKVRKVQSSYIK
jgi:superfamily II DNA/RNA helicase